jgi:hypothetical protein
MNRTRACVARMLSIAAWALGAGCAGAAQAAEALALQSDQKLGFVTVNSDLVLVDDRLSFTVGAFNKSSKTAQLTPSAIAVTTAAGKPVPLATLAELENDARVALGGRPSAPDAPASVTPAHRPHDVTASGESESGYTGGDTLAAGASPRKRKKADPEAEAKIQKAVDELRAVILQGVAIEPRAAGGGQVVTQPLRFARGEPRKLRMTVDFAGERHEFEVAVPAPPGGAR